MSKESSHESSYDRLSLEHRLKHLEEQARFTLDVLEMASTLGDFQTSINELSEPSALLEETVARISELVRFTASAFYLVDESTSDFSLSLCVPEDMGITLEAEMEHLIDNGVFSLAVRENRPITVYSRDNSYRLVLHVLATTSRTRGMFVGVMPRGERNLSGILLSLLSIVLKHCANAIESFELYRLFRERMPVKEQWPDLPACLLELYPDGTVSWLNDEAAAILKISVTGKPHMLFDSLQLSSRPVFNKALDDVQRDGRWCGTVILESERKNALQVRLSLSLAEGRNSGKVIRGVFLPLE